MSDFKCHFCEVCNGTGCIGEMPGMGGPNNSTNFILNYDEWDKVKKIPETVIPVHIRLSPMTGGEQNVGYDDERQFYFDLIDACDEAGVELSIGDGCPDEKLLFGIEAVQNRRKVHPDLKTAVFIKPYPDARIYERIEWASPVAESIGIDIDSYNIVTMRNLVHLEQKTPDQLKEIKKYLNSKGLPFAIKGIFKESDMEIVREVKPDIAYISNHGGRVETVKGSTAEFLARHSAELKSNSGELWVDGGIRNAEQVQTAACYGATTVALGRPFATAICRDRENEVKQIMKKLCTWEK